MGQQGGAGPQGARLAPSLSSRPSWSCSRDPRYGMPSRTSVAERLPAPSRPPGTPPWRDGRPRQVQSELQAGP